MPHYLISIEPIRADTRPVLSCEYCHYRIATWRVACGPDTWFYCDEHEGPPCGGVFVNDFVITAETTRDDVLRVVGCGSHRIHTPSGRDVHELWCCVCSEWIGDTEDPEIKHVSVSLSSDCHPEESADPGVAPCQECREAMAVLD